MIKIEELKDGIQNALGEGYACKIVETRKNNKTLSGLSISKSNDSNAIIAYPVLEDASEVSELIDSMICTIHEHFDKLEHFSDMTQNIREWEYVKAKIFLRISGDTEYAEKYLHWKFENLYAIPYVSIDEHVTFNITPEHLEMYNVTKEEIWDCAINNMDGKAKLIDPADFYSGNIINIFENQENFDPEKPTLYALIADNGDNFDAGYILLESVHQKLQKLFPDGYYIIPSSISDSLVVPSCTEIELALKVVSETNNDQLDPVMAMPNNAYIYENGALKLIV